MNISAVSQNTSFGSNSVKRSQLKRLGVRDKKKIATRPVYSKQMQHVAGNSGYKGFAKSVSNAVNEAIATKNKRGLAEVAETIAPKAQEAANEVANQAKEVTKKSGNKHAVAFVATAAAVAAAIGGIALYKHNKNQKTQNVA